MITIIDHLETKTNTFNKKHHSPWQMPKGSWLAYVTLDHKTSLKSLGYICRPVFPAGFCETCGGRWCHNHLHIHCHCIKFAFRQVLAFQICSTLWNVTYCNTTECPIKLNTLYFLLSYIKRINGKHDSLIGYYLLTRNYSPLYSLNPDL